MSLRILPSEYGRVCITWLSRAVYGGGHGHRTCAMIRCLSAVATHDWSRRRRLHERRLRGDIVLWGASHSELQWSMFQTASGTAFTVNAAAAATVTGLLLFRVEQNPTVNVPFWVCGAQTADVTPEVEFTQYNCCNETPLPSEHTEFSGCHMLQEKEAEK